MSDNEENKKQGRRNYSFKNINLWKYRDKIMPFRDANTNPETGEYVHVPNEEFDTNSLSWLKDNELKNLEMKKDQLLKEREENKRYYEDYEQKRQIEDLEQMIEEERNEFLRQRRDEKFEKEKQIQEQFEREYDYCKNADKRGHYDENKGVYSRTFPNKSEERAKQNESYENHRENRQYSRNQYKTPNHDKNYNDYYEGNMDKKYNLKQQKEIDDLRFRVQNVESNPRMGRFEKYAANSQELRLDRDKSPAGLSITHARNVLKCMEDVIEAKQEPNDRERNRRIEETVLNLSSIGKYQYEENIQNKQCYNTNMDDFTPDYINIKSGTFNIDKCADKIKMIKTMGINFENHGLAEYIKLFKWFDLSQFNQQEFNMIFHNVLSKNYRDRVESCGIIPTNETTKDYLNQVNEAIHGRQSEFDIETTLENFKPNKNTIMEIFEEIKRKVNNISNSYMNNMEKERRIINMTKKHLPQMILTMLRQEQAGRTGSMNLKVFKSFLSVHQNSADWYLKTKKQTMYESKVKRSKVNKISNQYNEFDTDQDNFNQMHQNYETYTGSESSDTESCYDDLEDSYLKVHKFDRQQTSRDRQKESRYGQNSSRFTNDKKYPKRVYVERKCTICKSDRHDNEWCKINPDDKIRIPLHGKLGINFCYKCKITGHNDLQCQIFKEKITNKACERCEKEGYYEYYHLPADCIKINFLEKIKGR